MLTKPIAEGAPTVAAVSTAAPSSIVCSVIIGLVSRREAARILAVLAALRGQTPPVRHEVIVADRLNNVISKRIATEFPEVRLLSCAPDTTLPALRTHALAVAQGRYAVVTEDHCIPDRTWLAAIIGAFERAPPGTIAVGGGVVNGLPQRWLDRATFQCEYGCYQPPRLTGPCSDLPGMNVAYVRERLLALDRGRLTSGFWETTAHPVLLREGAGFFSSNEIEVVHCKHIAFSEFVAQRYWYSRYYAGNRFARNAWLKRAAAMAMSPALPLLLLWRFHRNALHRRRYAREFIALIPLLLVFATIWAGGEMAGYALGPGDALRRLE